MRRKLFFLMCFVSLLCLVNTSFADCYWSDGGANLWNDANNWEGGVPGSEDKAWVDTCAHGPIIQDGIDAVCLKLCGPAYDAGPASMYLTGGTLTVGDYWRMGKNAAAGPGHVYMSGGNVTVNCGGGPDEYDEGLVVCRASSIECIFDMSGGFIDIKGYLAITAEYDDPVGTGTGTLNLTGGTIQAKYFTMGPGTAKFDIAGGTLILEGNITELPGVTGYGREGALVFDYDPGTTKTTITAAASPFATQPSPDDREQDVHPDDDLSWVAGRWAADVNAHDIYFGIDWNDVNDANKLSDEYKGSQDLENTSFVLDRLDFGRTYYWRIDEVNDACQPGQPWKGTVWKFTVDDGKAHTPSPGDSTMSISTDTTLSWTGGILATSSDNLYFGTDWNDVNDGTGGTDKGSQSPGYAPGGLEIGTTYYWRVDAVGDTTVKGDIWRFTTVGAVLMYYQFDGVEDNNLPDPITDSTGNVTFNHLEKEHDGSLTYGPSNPFMNTSGTSARFTPDDGLFRFDTGSGDVLDLDIPAYTIEMFIRPNNLGDDGTLIRRAEGSYALVIEEDAGVVRMEFEQSDASPVSFPVDSMQEGKWYHIAAVFDSTDVNAPQKLYLDGELVVSGGTTALNPDTGGPCGIGDRREPDGGNEDFYDGLIDELRISDMALEPKQFLLPIDPGQASNPSPKNLAEDVPPNVVLSWTPGDYAAEHDVYLGTSFDDVNDADTSSDVYVERRGPNEYDPGGLALNTTYYWRIDEVNTIDPNMWKGKIWKFTVANYIIVDDFESYTSSSDMWANWKDGWNNDTGSTLLLGVAPTDPTHGGDKSQLYSYNNMGTPYYSEVERVLGAGEQDFTEAGVDILTMYFYGKSTNTATTKEQLYAGLDDGGTYAEVRYGTQEGESITDIQVEDWTEWNVALSDFTSVTLSSVDSLFIGFGNRASPEEGGWGLVYFDDIRLYPSRCVPSKGLMEADLSGNCVIDIADVGIMGTQWLLTDVNFPDRGITVSEPSTSNLVGFWKLEGNGDDSSGKGNNGVPEGTYSWVTGYDGVNQAIEFGGGRVLVPDDVTLRPASVVSAACWVYYDDDPGSSARVVVKGPDNFEAYCLELGGAYEFTFYVGEPNGQRYFADANEGDVRPGEWMHLGGTYDGTTVKSYVNGVVVGTEANSISLSQDPNGLAIGNRSDANDRPFTGIVDEVRVYNAALSQAEMAWMATDGTGYVPLNSAANLYDEESEGNKSVNMRDYAELMLSWLDEKLWPRDY